MKNKFLLTGDFHVENNKNLENVVETSNWILDECLNRQITNIIILGDFLNSRDKIDSLALNTAVDILDKFNDKGIKPYILLGNHEKYNKSLDFKINSIKVFKKHANVIDKFRVLKFDLYNFVMIPYIDDKKVFEDILSKVNDNLDQSKKNYLLLHQPIFGAVVNDANNLIDYNSTFPTLFKKFAHVYSGHFHTYQKFSNVTYVGSPVQLSHGEERGDKGITIIDLATDTTEFVVNPKFRKYITTEDIDADVDGKFVRFYLKEYKDSSEIGKIKDVLKSKGAKDVRIEFKINETNSIDYALNKMDLTELVKKYIDVNKGSLDGTRLFQIGDEIRKKTKEKML